jgi:hypothetical protein
VASLAPEYQEIAAVRSKEINQAFSVLRDANQRATYDAQLRRGAGSSSGQRNPDPPSPEPPKPAPRAASSKSASGTFDRRLAIGVSLFVGNAALFVLPRLANFGFVLLGHFIGGAGRAPSFFDLLIPIDEVLFPKGSTDPLYWLVFLPYAIFYYYLGVFAHRCGARMGKAIDWRFNDAYTGSRPVLFVSFIVTVAVTELVFNDHTVASFLADFFILLGAYHERDRRN